MAAEIRAGLNKPYPIFINEAKTSLKDNGKAELHGLGDAIVSVVRAAEMLTSKGYANLVSFHTNTLNEERDGKKNNKPKVIVTLEKAQTFEKASREYEDSRKKSN